MGCTDARRKERLKKAEARVTAQQEIIDRLRREKEVLSEIAYGSRKEPEDTTEVFEHLQYVATRTGAAKATFTIERPDGWHWQLVAIAPGEYKDDDNDEQ